MATRQLGEDVIEEIKKKIGWSDESFESGKRRIDVASTGLSPVKKKLNMANPIQTANTILSLRNPFHNPATNHRRIEEIQSLTRIIESQSSLIKDLENKLNEKDDVIHVLQAHVTFLSDPSLPSSTFLTDPLGSTLSPPRLDPPMMLSSGRLPSESTALPGSSSDTLSFELCESQAPLDSSQKSYLKIKAEDPIQPLQQTLGPTADGLKEDFGLQLIYLMGVRLNVNKIGEFKRQARKDGLYLESVKNVSFIGSNVIELMVEKNGARVFIDRAKAAGYTVNTELNVVKKDKGNPVWLEYGGPTENLSDLIKEKFLSRIAREIKTCSDERVRNYYLEWADSLGWTNTLSFASTFTSLSHE